MAGLGPHLRTALAGPLELFSSRGLSSAPARIPRLRYSHKRSGRAPPQPAARRRPISFSAGPWTRPEGRAETTRGIASLHFEIGAFTGAAPDQFELPSGAPNAGHRQR